MSDVYVSVLMSIYSEPEEWLREAIDSILNQSFTDFEFIIINDNPKRNLNRIILNEYKLKDKRIIIISNKENLGLTRSLNKGLKIARGKYIARMDADDISFSDRFEKQYNYMELNPEIIACGGWIKIFGSVREKEKKTYQIKHKDITSLFFVFSPFAHPTLFMRNDLLKRNNIYYDEDFPHAEDYRLAFELIKNGRLSNIPEIILKYRINSNQISQKQSNIQIKNSSKIRRMAINYFLEQLEIYQPIPPKINVNFIRKLRTLEIENKHASNVNCDLQKKFNTIRMISILSLEKYSIKSFLYFLFSCDYLKPPYTFRRFMIVIYKHFFPKTWHKFI